MTAGRAKLLSDEGPPASATTTLAQPLIGDLKPIDYVTEGNEMLDAPDHLQMVNVQVNDSRPLSYTGRDFDLHGGIDQNLNAARNAAIGEAIERYCLSVVSRDEFADGPYDGGNQINPERFNNLPRELNESVSYHWVEAVDVANDRQVELPGHIVYCPFHRQNTSIRSPITTGAAAHTSYREAVKAGILEVIEREAFIINYLHQIPGRRIPDQEIGEPTVSNIISPFEESGLQVNLVYLSLDLPVHVVLSILWDQQLEFATFGLSAGFEFEETIIDAVTESYHVYPWQRTVEPQFHNPKEITDLETRAEHWKAKGRDWDGISYWMETDSERFEMVESVSALADLLDALEQKDLSIYVKDITTKDVSPYGFKAVRVIIPECHPLYLDERFRYTTGERLYDAPKNAGFETTKSESLNEIPQPFL
jgi:ribosomal protein S12 methylthiotransferase accessory factor